MSEKLQILHYNGIKTNWKKCFRLCIYKYKIINYLLAAVAIVVICEHRPQAESYTMQISDLEYSKLEYKQEIRKKCCSFSLI